MRWLLISLALLLFAAAPSADAAYVGQSVTASVQPMPFTGQGMMSITASTAIAAANITLSPGSSAFPAASTPLPTGLIRIKPQAAVTFCQYGGPASATNCEMFAGGESRTIALSEFASKVPTLFPITGTVAIEIEW